jgi:hypothetical protein
VDFVAGLIFIRDGLPYDEAVRVVAQDGGIEAVGFGGHDADVLVGAELWGDAGIGAVYYIYMLHFRGPRGQRDSVERGCGEEFAEFAPAFGIAGEAGIEVSAIESEFYSEDGLDIPFAALFDPGHGTGGVVDIGEGHGGDTSAGGAFGKLFG